MCNIWDISPIHPLKLEMKMEFLYNNTVTRETMNAQLGVIGLRKHGFHGNGIYINNLYI